ncbi:MAG: VCBS repeat-containing protein, partial [Planctomycetia bacterium]
LYVFNSQGEAVRHFSLEEDDVPDEITTSNVPPWSRLFTGILATYTPPDENGEGGGIFDDGEYKYMNFEAKAGEYLYDDETLTIIYNTAVATEEDPNPTPVPATITFEYDLGLVARVDGMAVDGETFTIGSKTFEFDSGPYMDLQDYTLIPEGATFTLEDDDGNERTYEFDTDGIFDEANIPIDLSEVSTKAQAAGKIVNAINSSDPDMPSIVAAAYQNGVIELANDTFYDDSNLGPVDGISFQGEGVQAGNIAISFDVDITDNDIIPLIMNAVDTQGITANTAGNRIAFPSETSADFSNVASISQEGNSANGVEAGNIRIPVLLTDSASDVATTLATTINGQTVALTATATGSNLELTNVMIGKVTGFTFVGNTLYACDDIGNVFTAGGLNARGFNIVEPEQGNPFIIENENGPSMTLINNFGTEFYGMTLGPQHVEDGVYADILFVNGEETITAINTEGHLTPIFANGLSTLDIPELYGIEGLAFSTLDYSLWHGSTFNYPNNPNVFPDYYEYLSGNSDILDTYDLPGGAHGTLLTSTFSLEGYSPDDLPLLTFNYTLETDGDFGATLDDPYSFNSSVNTDSLRVFLSDDGVNWTLVATNLGMTNFADVLIDGSGVTQQCQIDMRPFIDPANFAESYYMDDVDNLQLKFEFATSGSMGTGDQNSDGTLEKCSLKVVRGADIEDGDSLTIQGFDGSSETYTYEIGYSLRLPNSAGQKLEDGDFIKINDSIVFEFDKDNTTKTIAEYKDAFGDTFNVNEVIAIPLNEGDATFPVAMKVANIINQRFQQIVDIDDPNGSFAYSIDDRIYLPLVTDLSVNAGTIATEGALPTSDPADNILRVYPWTTSEEVAEMTVNVINEAFLNEMYRDVETFAEHLTTVKRHGDMLTFYGGATVSDAGPHLDFSGNQEGDAGLMPAVALDRRLGQTDTTLTNAGNDDYWKITSQAAANVSTQYYYNLQGQDNQHAGFQLLNVGVDLVERGESVGGGESDFRQIGSDPDVSGTYHLVIRSASEYGGRSFNTNERHTEDISLLIPDAGDIANYDTFTIYDGVNSRIFQFIDPEVGDGDALPTAKIIEFEQGQTGAEIAQLVVQAINSQNTVDVTATVYTNEETFESGSNQVDLFNATSVSGMEHIVFDGNSSNITQNLLAADIYAEADFAGKEVDDFGEPLADIVNVNNDDETIQVLRQFSLGQYFLVETLGIETEVSDIELGDVNNDGLLDIIVTCYTDHTIAIALNNSDGHFGKFYKIDTAMNPKAIEIGYLDDDENLDVAIISESENLLSVYLGNGDGTFAAPDNYDTELVPKGL